MSEFGIKIKNISAGMLYDVNLGTRDYFTYTDAMFNNSLFSFFLQKNGLNIYKGESTRDIICLDYEFGSRSYDNEHARLEKLFNDADGDSQERIKHALCPMNWLEDWINKIQNASTTNTIPTSVFFVKMNGEANRRQMTKMMKIIEDYDSSIKSAKINISDNEEYVLFLFEKNSAIISELSKMKIRNVVTINRLIEISLGLSSETGASKNRTYNPEKHTRKILNLLYKMDKNKFLMNFSCK